MFAKGGLKRNVTSNLGGYVLTVLIAFVVSPILIRSLGDARYGVWTLVAEITGYYGLLDLGIRGAISHYTARHLAQQNPEALRSSLASGFWFLAALGTAVLAVGAVLAYLFPDLFRIDGVKPSDAQLAMLIMSGVIATNLPMATLSGALVGHQRLDLVNVIEVTTRVLGAVAIVVAMKGGGGLVSLACIQAGIAAGRWIMTSVALARSGSGLALSPRLATRSAWRDLVGYGSRSLAINLAQMVIYQTDTIVIALFLGPIPVTIYSIGQMLIRYLAQASAAVCFSFTPRLTELASRGESEEVKRTYLMGARTAGGLAAPLAGCMAAFGSPFIALWLGEKYVTGDWSSRSDVIMIILLAAQLPRILQNMSWQLAFATRKQGFLARLTAGEAVVNLSLSLALVRPLGLIGVALGTLIPLAVTHLLIVPAFVSRTYGVTAREYLVRGVGRPLLLGAALCLLGLALTHWLPSRTWTIFFIEATITALVGIALAYRFVLDPTTRRGVRNGMAGAFRQSD